MLYRANPRGSELKLSHKRAVEILLVLIGDSRSVFGKANDAGIHRDTVGTKRLLDVVLILQEHFLEIVIEMKLDLIVSLLNLHTKEVLCWLRCASYRPDTGHGG
jgi:hypothetical protein